MKALLGLHPAFRFGGGHDGWAWNKNPFRHQGEVDRKLLIRFNEQHLCYLDIAPTIGKIGSERYRQEYSFVGFFYGNLSNTAKLVNFARNFPEAEVIIGLDAEYRQTEKSQVVCL